MSCACIHTCHAWPCVMFKWWLSRLLAPIFVLACGLITCHACPGSVHTMEASGSRASLDEGLLAVATAPAAAPDVDQQILASWPLACVTRHDLMHSFPRMRTILLPWRHVKLRWKRCRGRLQATRTTRSQLTREACAEQLPQSLMRACVVVYMAYSGMQRAQVVRWCTGRLKGLVISCQAFGLAALSPWPSPKQPAQSILKSCLRPLSIRSCSKRLCSDLQPLPRPAEACPQPMQAQQKCLQ